MVDLPFKCTKPSSIQYSLENHPTSAQQYRYAKQKCWPRPHISNNTNDEMWETDNTVFSDQKSNIPH